MRAVAGSAVEPCGARRAGSGWNPTRVAGCGGEGVLEVFLELSRWFETLPGASVNSTSVTQLGSFPRLWKGYVKRLCYSKETFVRQQAR